MKFGKPVKPGQTAKPAPAKQAKPAEAKPAKPAEAVQAAAPTNEPAKGLTIHELFGIKEKTKK